MPLQRLLARHWRARGARGRGFGVCEVLLSLTSAIPF